MFLGGEVDDDAANIIVAQMLFLEMEDPDADIMLYINSPGGSVTAGHGHLRYHEVPQVRGVHPVRRHGRVDGRVPPGGGREGQAQGAARTRRS